MNKTISRFLWTELRLLAPNLEHFLPEPMRFVPQSILEEPLVYTLYPIFFILTVVAIGVAVITAGHLTFIEAGQRNILWKLSRTHPENRHEEFKRLCEENKIDLIFEEDFDDNIEEDHNEKDFLIDVV